LYAKRIQSGQDVIRRFQANQRGYFRRHRICLILAALAALADMGSTIHFMQADGPEAEGHPAVRLVSTALGPIVGPVVDI